MEMSEPEKVYEDRAVIIRRGHDDRGWLFIEQTFFPLPKYDNNVKHRVSLSPTGKTVELLKRWDGWSLGEGGLTGSASMKLRLDESEGGELRKKLRELRTPEEFGELWDRLYLRD
jgi:hypothetical protein